MNNELLKVLVLPALVTTFSVVAVLAERHGAPSGAKAALVLGWLGAAAVLTLLARESQEWRVAGYLQNGAVFLGLCAIPFAVSFAASSWLFGRVDHVVAHAGATVVLSLLAILPGALLGPWWALLLRSGLGWRHIQFP